MLSALFCASFVHPFPWYTFSINNRQELVGGKVNEMKKSVLTVMSYVLVAVLASAATFGVMSLTGNEDDYTKLEQLSDLIQEKFIGEADVTAMEDAAAMGMIAALGDRWSHYISAAEYQAYQDQMNNSYVGVGITIQLREDGYLDIVDVVPGGPADGVGILAGDILIRADGADCAELGLDGTRDRGEENTDVSLTVKREGEEITFEVTRAYFEVPVVSYQLLEDTVGYIAIENFDSRCADETIAAIEDLLSQGATALLFDVRNNPGGYKTELCEVLDYLLPEGPLFRSEYYDGTVKVDESGPEHLDIPMGVLVNSESYSAAEFFAAALREYDAAFVAGQQTTGKGYFQQTYQLSDGSAVGLSVGKYTTPNGVSLADVGITPDIEVEVDEELFWQIYYGNVEPEEDPQIQAAMDALKVGNLP